MSSITLVVAVAAGADTADRKRADTSARPKHPAPAGKGSAISPCRVRSGRMERSRRIAWCEKCDTVALGRPAAGPVIDFRTGQRQDGHRGKLVPEAAELLVILPEVVTPAAGRKRTEYSGLNIPRRPGNGAGADGADDCALCLCR